MMHTPGPFETWVDTLSEVDPPMRRKAALLDQALREADEAVQDYYATLGLLRRDIEVHWPGTPLPDVPAFALAADNARLRAALKGLCDAEVAYQHGDHDGEGIDAAMAKARAVLEGSKHHTVDTRERRETR